jgi:putative addiction module killer protein
MFTVLQTDAFRDWLDGLMDSKAQVRIAARLRLAEAGSLGDWKSVGSGISEMRVDVGPGYRLYFTRRQNIIIVMLAGGDKSTQARDMKRAQKILTELDLRS